ncbi:MULTISPECIES: nitroreductase family deazaflavin-dependent oxidoreductase [unclassified Streptomyces]|uniref:nitroreductase family deazaflavin-dependent oxidoreductase n=1 Tax=unclassified Streptomyces TaxID=2593676 RepID=UPI003434A1C4
MNATGSDTGGVDGDVSVAEQPGGRQRRGGVSVRAGAPVRGVVLRVMQRIIPARWAAVMMRVLVVPLDTVVQMRSGGRFGACGLLGVPSLLLVTVGARSGRLIPTPLCYVGHAGGYAVVASNFGRAHHPAWSSNLLKNPAATICTGGRRMPVSARLVTGVERDEIWQGFLSISSQYQTYRDRSGRDLRIFCLQPVGPEEEGLPR